MASSPTLIQQRFRNAFSQDIIAGLAKVTWAAYPEADTICRSHLLRDQIHDVRGVLRRGVVERNWKNYSRRIPGATVRQEANSIGSSKHVVIEIDGVILTQSLADGPADIIQQAHFRDNYAEISQLELFGQSAAVQRAHNAGKLYGMFLHGASSTNPKQPRFMAVAFPTKDCKAYVYDATIHVFAELETLAQAIRTDRTEEIGDDLMLELRRLDEDEETGTA